MAGGTSAFVRPSVDVRYSEIAPADLIGIAAVGGVLCPPSESWLGIADRVTGAALGAWFDVQISAEQILAVFPAPLVAEPPPEDAENGLDHELWLLAGAGAPSPAGPKDDGLEQEGNHRMVSW